MAIGKCVECGREVSTDAASCPGCGKAKPTKKKLGLGAKIGIGFLVLLFIGMVVPNASKDRAASSARPGASSAPAAPAQADVQVSADDLWRAYQANEVAADGQYKDRRLLVTGVVDSITKDFTEAVIVSLRAPNQFMPSMAYLSSSGAGVAGQLRKGQGVRVLCTGGGMLLGRPVLRECTVTAVGK